MILIRLRHAGGSTQDTEAIGVDGLCILIRWGMAGLYKLHVKQNILYGARVWRADSQEEAWRVWRALKEPHKPDINKTYPQAVISKAEQETLAAYRKAGIG